VIRPEAAILMRFVTRDAAEIALEKLLRNHREQSRPEIVLSYPNQRLSYEGAGRAMAGSLGDLVEAARLYQFSFPGDGGDAASPRRKGYYLWRTKHGEHHRVHQASGHVFGPGEIADVQRLLHGALDLGCDTWLSARPAPTRLFSHDDRIEIFRSTDKRKLDATAREARLSQSGVTG